MYCIRTTYYIFVGYKHLYGMRYLSNGKYCNWNMHQIISVFVSGCTRYTHSLVHCCTFTHIHNTHSYTVYTLYTYTHSYTHTHTLTHTHKHTNINTWVRVMAGQTSIFFDFENLSRISGPCPNTILPRTQMRFGSAPKCDSSLDSNATLGCNAIGPWAQTWFCPRCRCYLALVS